MKRRLGLMVVLSFALHGWLLWAAPAQVVKAAPSGVVALKLGQVNLATPAAEAPVALEQPAAAELQAVQASRPGIEPMAQAAPLKPVQQEKLEPKPAPKFEPEIKTKAEPGPKPEKPAKTTDAQLFQAATAKAVSDMQGVSEEPVLVERPAFAGPPSAPVYPELARQRRQQGTVVVEVQLDQSGAQVLRKLLQSSGVDSLDEAALTAVAKWQFLPFKENGRARHSRVRLPIRFSL